jgi:hypothetical protein
MFESCLMSLSISVNTITSYSYSYIAEPFDCPLLSLLKTSSALQMLDLRSGY